MQKTNQTHTSFSNLFSMEGFKEKKYEYYDYSLLAVMILLTCFGLVMLYSTSAYTAEVQFNDDMFYFKKQAMYSALSILVAVGVSIVDYHLLEKFQALLYWAAFVLMILVRTSLGYASHGARRWLEIGPIHFQPAEIAKIALIVCLSHAIITIGRSIKTMRGTLLLLGMGALQAFVAFVFTDNLSTAIIIFGITWGMVFIAHPKYSLFILSALAVILLAVLAVRYVDTHMKTSTDFRVLRILAWLHPEEYSGDLSYQSLQARYAVGSGGLLGRGLGNSIQKLGSVPEAQNDFIFSIICEELGIIGGAIVLAFFAYLLYRLYFIALNAPDLFGSLLVSGIFIHISLQVLLNVAVVLGLLPNTGVTLPFISYGGTSVMFIRGEMGVALSVARRIPLKEPRMLL